MTHTPLNISVDLLFPSGHASGTSKKLDINSLFNNTPLNTEPNISFDSNILIKRIQQRRYTKLICYMKMLKYCYSKIIEADDFQDTDILFTTLDIMHNCKEYQPHECIEYISNKLRADMFDTLIISNNTLFISWYNMELKKQLLQTNAQNKIKQQDN